MSKLKVAPLTLFLILLCMIVGGCDKYSDDLQNLGKRVEKLEDSLNVAGKEVERLQKYLLTLQQLAQAIESDGYVNQLTKNPDGSFTIVFNNGSSFVVHQGKDGANGVDGADGKSVEDLGLTMKRGSDGVLYWWMGNDWLLDGNGNKMRASGVDGKDGVDGQDGADGTPGKDNLTAIIPQTRINNVTNEWEISTDGGTTWTSTGVKGNGIDGANGKDATPDIFLLANVDEVSKVVTFYLKNGSVIQAPILEVLH